MKTLELPKIEKQKSLAQSKGLACDLEGLGAGPRQLSKFKKLYFFILGHKKMETVYKLPPFFMF